MFRSLPRFALAASLTAVACFEEVPANGATEGTDSSGGSDGTTTEAGTGASGDITTAGTDQTESDSGFALIQPPIVA